MLQILFGQRDKYLVTTIQLNRNQFNMYKYKQQINCFQLLVNDLTKIEV
jgi:hypothetical protein